MNEDLHSLFESEAGKMIVGPPPSFANPRPATRHPARWTLIGSAAVLASFYAGYVYLGMADSDAPTARDPGHVQVSSTPGDSPQEELGDVMTEPANLPDCGDGEISIRFVDWLRETAPTARAAAEQLLGKALPEAAVDEVTRTRRDILVADDIGRTRAVIVVSSATTGEWAASTIYNCADDMLDIVG